MAFKLGNQYTNPLSALALYGSEYNNGQTIASNRSTITNPQSSTVTNAAFGWNVAVGPGQLFVGATEAQDGVGTDVGKVYVYNWDGSVLQQTIEAPAGESPINFGYRVRYAQGVLAIADVYTLGPNRVYLYRKNDQTNLWVRYKTIGTGTSINQLGFGLAVGCGRIVVTQYISSGSNGIIAIYNLDGDLITSLTGDEFLDDTSRLGWDVDIGCGKIILGGPTYDNNRGVAVLLDLNGNYINKIQGYTSSDSFGNSVAIGQGRIAIGAPVAYSGYGAVYVYDLNLNLLYTLTGSDSTLYNATSPTTGDGTNPYASTITSGDLGSRQRVKIGAGKIVLGDPADGSDGKAYVFDLNGTHIETLVAVSASGADDFGESLDIKDQKLIVGQPGFIAGGGSNVGGYAQVYDLKDLGSLITPWDVIDRQSFGDSA